MKVLKEILKDILWYSVIIITLPVTLPLVWWAIRQDDKEDKQISSEKLDAMFPIGYILPFQGTYPNFGKWEIINIPNGFGENVYIKRVG